MNTVLKYPGSKWSIADWIISYFPDDYEKMTYLEPYFGSGAIFFNKNRSKIETINDINDNVVNLFKVIRDRPDELSRAIQLTPWARSEYRLSYEPAEEELEKARRFMVRCWMAIGTKTSDITGWSNNIKPIDTGLSRWSKLSESIKQTSKRLCHEGMKIVQIENMNAVELIERYNRKETFVYCDPPYIMSTRSGKAYADEMTDADHEVLLNVLLDFKGKVMLSGYENNLYNRMLGGWNKQHAEYRCEKGKTATEVIWYNYEKQSRQIDIFEHMEVAK